jgi:two-component system chemotaxis response regulator CheB
MSYEILVIGASAGGIEALKLLLPRIEQPLDIPIIVIQHLQPDAPSYLAVILETASGLTCYEAEDKMVLEANCIYTPAPNYHIMMEKDWTLSLNVGERVAYARPSIDVLFESVADAAKSKVVGVLLTGANHDGAVGLKAIQDMGGYTIVQDPKEAFAKQMPESALNIMVPDEVLEIKEIANSINGLFNKRNGETNE